jgi:hypothetical protein
MNGDGQAYHTTCPNAAQPPVGEVVGRITAFSYYRPTAGGLLPDGWRGTFYDVLQSDNCTAHAQTRQSSNGLLFGDSQYKYTSCSPIPPMGNKPINNLQVVLTSSPVVDRPLGNTYIDGGYSLSGGAGIVSIS